MTDIEEFHKSTYSELKAIKDRVRYLISDSYWPSDGRYKEAILRNMIKKFLPMKYNIGTGFVVKKLDEGAPIIYTSEIDLIIYENNSPILFSEEDFIITTPSGVRGIIEVKTDVSNQDLKKIIEKMNENGKKICMNRTNSSGKFFNGVFSYDFSKLRHDMIEYVTNNVYNVIKTFYETNLSSKNYFVNHICLNQDYFINYWFAEHKYKFFEVKNLAYSFFISNLIEILSRFFPSPEYHMWFPFNKNPYKKSEIDINNTDE